MSKHPNDSKGYNKYTFYMCIYLTISYLEAERDFTRDYNPVTSGFTNTVFDKVKQSKKKSKKQNVQQLLKVGQ